jgi:hypothetical protein
MKTWYVVRFGRLRRGRAGQEGKLHYNVAAFDTEIAAQRFAASMIAQGGHRVTQHITTAEPYTHEFYKLIAREAKAQI